MSPSSYYQLDIFPTYTKIKYYSKGNKNKKKFLSKKKIKIIIFPPKKNKNTKEINKLIIIYYSWVYLEII